MVKSTALLFDKNFCQSFNILPCKNNGQQLEVIVSEASDLSVIDYISFKTQGEIELQWVSSEELNQKLEKCFEDTDNTDNKIDKLTANHKIDEYDNEVVKQIDAIISTAINEEASDIHFEPSEKYLVSRTRIDGTLQVRNRISSDKTPAFLSRIKIMAGLDIAEKRRPQDGRIRYSIKNRVVDIRVSVIPTDFGEKAVLRILDKQQLRLDLKSLGFTSEQLSLFKDKISMPHGIILVTGPTGSGKTTTLYAALNFLRSPEVNISTVEDPIEYNLEGINQTQVKPGIGVTFSSMLRALLRQDPNIIMVGEIRDKETLEIAIRASLTGHLVISTLHTNDSISTITRLLDMGAEPLLLASTLRLIVAQRLVRKICSGCYSNQLSEENFIASRKLNLEVNSKIGNGKGCNICHMTGYSGRTSLFEMLPIDGEIKLAIENRKSEEVIRQTARKAGFKTLLEHGQQLILEGVTSPLEVLKEVCI